MFKQLVFLGIMVITSTTWALPDPVSRSQKQYEASIQAAVRNKMYNKSSGLEFGVTAGFMPYDLIVDHFNFGGRLTWHIGDHVGWEIIDFQVVSPRLTSFTNDLASDDNKKVKLFDVAQVKSLGFTSLLVSPFYGKVRFIGSSVLYFDLYTVFGLGMANVETSRLAHTDSSNSFTTTSLKTEWTQGFSFGIGLKFFVNSAMGFLIDFRDYVAVTETYNQRSLKSNYVVMLGLSFFIPPL